MNVLPLRHPSPDGLRLCLRGLVCLLVGVSLTMLVTGCSENGPTSQESPSGDNNGANTNNGATGDGNNGTTAGTNNGTTGGNNNGTTAGTNNGTTDAGTNNGTTGGSNNGTTADAGGPTDTGEPGDADGEDAPDPEDGGEDGDSSAPEDVPDPEDSNEEGDAPVPEDAAEDAAEDVPDCNGEPPGTWYVDEDGDGAGDSDTATVACSQPPGFVEEGGDCDDTNPELHPDANEICDGVDNDCNGIIDDFALDEVPWYADADGDGQGDPFSVILACAQPLGFVDNASDCNDSDPLIGACPEGQTCSLEGSCIPDGACLVPQDCGEGTYCDDQGQCVPGSECGGQEYTAERVAPDLLIVLDRSCSMRRRVADVRKWQSAVDSIVSMTTTFDGEIRFGLTLFPDRVNPACQQAEIPIPTGLGNEEPIQTLLTNALNNNDPNWPDGPCKTNIDTAMSQAAINPGFADATRPGFVMLITDGKQAGCSAGGGNSGTLATIESLLADSQVATFVVGFGGEVNPTRLDEWAIAGGVPRQNADRSYYQADNPDDLLQVVSEIGQEVLGCEYLLGGEAPPSADDLYAFFNTTERVQRDPDHQDGWDYDPQRNAVVFYGPTCDRITSREVTDVDIVFGCQYE